MATPLQVSYIHKIPRDDWHTSIESIGGWQGDLLWRITPQDALKYMDDDVFLFYVQIGEHSVPITEYKHGNHRHIKTVPNNIGIDNLLSLPEFPQR